MAKNGRSFFERLTGTVNTDEFDTNRDDGEPELRSGSVQHLTVEHEEPPQQTHEITPEEQEPEDSGEGQLTVDVYNKPEEIVIKAIVAGVKPEDLDISITRDMVTIRGRREDEREVSDDDYFYQELYWGAFSRTVLLPQEIEVEAANASEKHGLLIIRLPKINKEKQTKLKVRPL